MSTEILANEKEGIYLTRFYGGVQRGECYQITVGNDATDDSLIQGHGWVALTAAQMEQIIEAFQKSRRKP